MGQHIPLNTTVEKARAEERSAALAEQNSALIAYVAMMADIELAADEQQNGDGEGGADE